MQFYCFNLDKVSNNFVTRKLLLEKMHKNICL